MGYFGDTLSDLGRALGDAIDRALDALRSALDRRADLATSARARLIAEVLDHLCGLWDRASTPVRLVVASAVGCAITLGAALFFAALLRRPAPSEPPPAHAHALGAVNSAVVARRAEFERRGGSPDTRPGPASSAPPPQRRQQP